MISLPVGTIERIIAMLYSIERERTTEEAHLIITLESLVQAHK